MNDTLKRLAIESGIHFQADRESRIHSVNTQTLEKFAQAIVFECDSIARAGNAIAVSDVIKERFGITE